MSKQIQSKDYLPLSWNDHARTLYLKALRDAVSINPTPSSQERQHGVKKQKVASSGLPLFRGAAICSAVGAQDDEIRDSVLDELKRWELSDPLGYSQYIGEDGLLNES